MKEEKEWNDKILQGLQSGWEITKIDTDCSYPYTNNLFETWIATIFLKRGEVSFSTVVSGIGHVACFG